MNKNVVQLSKLLSLVLRHQPDVIGIRLDENGWTPVDQLVTRMRLKVKDFDLETLGFIVDTNNKKRFAFNNDKTLIRASQGHSVDIELGLKPHVPPAVLYHGTAISNMPSILKTGLQKQQRNHVHLSETIETARVVGSRKGKPSIITIDAAAMHQQGLAFYLSENHVWLTNEVPATYFLSFDPADNF